MMLIQASEANSEPNQAYMMGNFGENTSDTSNTTDLKSKKPGYTFQSPG